MMKIYKVVCGDNLEKVHAFDMQKKDTDLVFFDENGEILAFFRNWDYFYKIGKQMQVKINETKQT